MFNAPHSAQRQVPVFVTAAQVSQVIFSFAFFSSMFLPFQAVITTDQILA
jgi:hypothetical protein